MSAKIIDGKQLSSDIRSEVAQAARTLNKDIGAVPGLAAILVGDDPASIVYIRNKRRACEEVGIFSETFHLESSVSQDDLISLIHQLNLDHRFHGILVQLPLPTGFDEDVVIDALDPFKDVDGLHPINGGRLLQGRPHFLPATPAGVQQMLIRSGYDPSGKHVVICGRSNIVGKPLAALLSQKAPGGNATVTLCHTGTTNLAAMTYQADILVVAVGQPKIVEASMVRPGAVVIDVGMNRIEDKAMKSGFRLVGDVDFGPVSELAAAITPVPGGVGPMTIAMLLVNTLKAAEYQAEVQSLS